MEKLQQKNMQDGRVLDGCVLQAGSFKSSNGSYINATNWEGICNSVCRCGDHLMEKGKRFAKDKTGTQKMSLFIVLVI